MARASFSTAGWAKPVCMGSTTSARWWRGATPWSAWPVVLPSCASALRAHATGLVLIGSATASRAHEAIPASGRWNDRRVPAEPQLRPFVLVLVLCVVGVALRNPSGPGLDLETLRMTPYPNVRAMNE